ncbi:glucokinase [Novosphingopyxis sp. YJ-S2-01]|uniref:glucokinase n=1 Tax=Novosphingopyxis sp. YJ-S2-01 TaxID=2794021 RepID=UPI0018DC2E7D|nr:glucokinase [Novosphingopyxis sp. YJ-S2-01]MBH9537246.1 glucokinase [Novosphingopyxis sp. YJ-S2-01]
MKIVTADIGGTHARFAIAEVEGGKVVSLGEATKMRAADHASLQIAWEAYGETLDEPLPPYGAIAIAAPIRSDAIKFTNNPWIVRPALMNERLKLEHRVLVNDFEAVAHAVAAVDDDQLMHITGPEGPLPQEGVISVVGPGTGLGVALLYREKGRVHVLPTEGGHSDFAPLDEVEERVLTHLRKKHNRVSVERVVAGGGLRAIWDVLAELEGSDVPKGDDKTLWSIALEGRDSIAEAALDRFCLCLGAVVGDIALTHGPGPVVLAGGLGARLADFLPRSGFAERFAAKGRFQSLMERQPVKLITHPEPGLFGAAAAFAKDIA